MARLDELREFLDYPNETLGVEYKSRLDFTDNEHKASLARHIAALANHGGGKIVFGFNDDLTVSESIPSTGDISRDTVSAIVRRYLEPALQCDVHFVRSSAGTDHPVIIVPSHGAAPICAKASGPEKNGKPRGIIQGTYYIRKAGPCSDPILTYAEWQPLIRRCAMHDRATLLSAIAGAIEPGTAVPDLEADLVTWHAAARREFDARIPEKKGSTNVGQHNLQLSYLIETEDGQRLPTSDFERVLIEVNNEVKDFVQSGWSMLFLFDRRELAPYWRNDETSGTEEDFLECSLVDQETIGDSADFWRASPDGRVSLIRDHWEDSSLLRTPQFEPYTRIDPQLLARSLGEIIRHARAFAGRFDAPVRIAFRCEWRGILGRKAQRLGGYSFVFGREAKINERSSHGVWSVLELAQHWERAAEGLAGPVARSLGIEHALSAEQVLKMAETWNRLG